MSRDILLAALSPDMETALLARWLKAVGDKVQAGDVLAEVETDKTTLEIAAVEAGVLAEIRVPAGTADVPVGTAIGRLASEFEFATATVPVPPTAAAAVPEAVPTQGSPTRTRVIASPAARRLARSANVNLNGLTGSGPNGRILKQDVIAASDVYCVTAQAAPPGATPRRADPDGDTRAPFIEMAHTPMRQSIAARLTEVKQLVPHFYLSADCTVDRVLSLRREINESLMGKSSDRKTSLNDWLIKALASALMEVPESNVSWTEAALRSFSRADIAVAVAVPGGLLTPIIRAADQKSLPEISQEMRALAESAREHKLRPDEYRGGTASLSNLGMFGVDEFTAILNPPQAVILAAGTAQERVIARAGQPAVATVMRCTLSVDHRAIDGSTAARLLAAIKRLIENPLLLIV